MTPKNPKELAKLMLQDQQLLQDFYNLVHEADELIEQQGESAMRRWLRERRVDLSSMDHRQVGDGVRRFYRLARLAGRYVRLW